MNNRRDFIKTSLASSAMISLSGAVPNFLLSASASSHATSMNKSNILVVVQLSGGNDGLNTVIPYEDDNYYKNRFTLAVGKQQVLKVDDRVGLNPALRQVHKLFKSRRGAIVQGVGYANPNRSHFESMDLWHTAHQDQSRIRLGWLGNAIEKISGVDLPAIHYGPEEQPLALANGQTAVPSIRSIDNFKLSAFRDKALKTQLNKIAQIQRTDENQLLGFIHESSNVALATSQRLESIRNQAQGNNSYPNTQLGRKLNSVARLIGSGLETQIYYVTLDGFDTHSNQRAAHNGLLQQLGDAIAAFDKDMGQQGNTGRVATMVFSEFGRRVRENASGGTDHGTAAPVFVFGDKIKSNVVGSHPSLTDLDQGDLKYKIDYRTVYAEMLKSWLGIDPAPIVGNNYKPVSIFS